MHYLDGHFIHSFMFKQIGVSRHVFKFPFDFIFHLKTSFRCWPMTGLAVHSNKRPASSVLHATPGERVACSRRLRKKSNEAAGGRQASCVTWRCVQHAVPLSVTDANPIGNWTSVKWTEPSNKTIHFKLLFWSFLHVGQKPAFRPGHNIFFRTISKDREPMNARQ